MLKTYQEVKEEELQNIKNIRNSDKYQQVKAEFEEWFNKYITTDGIKDMVVHHDVYEFFKYLKEELTSAGWSASIQIEKRVNGCTFFSCVPNSAKNGEING